jgi:hypothetical protein
VFALVASLVAGWPTAAEAGPRPLKGYITNLPPESASESAARHQRVAERRAGTIVIVHRGATAFAPENTLEAYAAADAWDHVVAVNNYNADSLLRHLKLRLLHYKAGLFDGRRDMDSTAVRAALARPGEMVIVDDPRVVARELEALLQSTNTAVRGTTILECLDHPTQARTAALRSVAPWALELPHAKR